MAAEEPTLDAAPGYDMDIEIPLAETPQTWVNRPTAQEVHPGGTHSYVHWVARVPHVPGREASRQALGNCGVQTKPYFRAPHMTGSGDSERLPVTERLDGQVLALPMSSEFAEEDTEQIVIAGPRCLAGRAQRRARP